MRGIEVQICQQTQANGLTDGWLSLCLIVLWRKSPRLAIVCILQILQINYARIWQGSPGVVLFSKAEATVRPWRKRVVFLVSCLVSHFVTHCTLVALHPPPIKVKSNWNCEGLSYVNHIFIPAHSPNTCVCKGLRHVILGSRKRNAISHKPDIQRNAVLRSGFHFPLD